MYMEKDGHFQLESSTDRALLDLQADLTQKVRRVSPDTNTGSIGVAETEHQQCQRCPALTPHAINALESLSQAESAEHAAEHLTRLAQLSGEQPARVIPASVFENRSVDWRDLTKLAANSLAQHNAWLGAPAQGAPAHGQMVRGKDDQKVELPKSYFSEKPKSWPARTWGAYSAAVEKLKPLRGGVGNTASSVLALVIGPDACILKILYVFYVHDGEDDYPYIPRNCGDWFDFAMFANAIKVPWVLIVGAMLTVITWSNSDR